MTISNTHSVCDVIDDWILLIHYVSDYTCNVNIFNINNNNWKVVHVLIDDISYRIKNDGSSMYVLKTETLMIRLDYSDVNTLIPKTIMQTWETRDCVNPYTKSSIGALKAMNPEYIYRFFDNTQRREFISTHFDINVCIAYDLLVSGAFQADLFRYCYLFIEGGCYVDYRMVARKPFRDILNENDIFQITVDYEKTNSMNPDIGTSYLNSLICSIPNHPFLKKAIDTCVANIIHNQKRFLDMSTMGGSYGCLDLTGPVMLYKTISGDIEGCNKRWKHIISNNDETDYKNFKLVDFESGVTLFTKKHPTEPDPSHYSLKWDKHEIFYRDIVDIHSTRIMVYPHKYKDSFLFRIHDDSIIITRVQKCGWWLDLKLRIVDLKTNETVSINVGRHNTPVKRIQIPINMLRGGPSNVLWSSSVKPSDLKLRSIVIAIPSIIIVSNTPIRGSNTRSVVSPLDRYKQTIEQLKSIRVKIPNCSIILLEKSLTLPREWLSTLSMLSDFIIRYNDEGDDYTYGHDSFNNKGLGEMRVLTHFGKLIETIPFKTFCKFGGRYKFNDEFRIKNFISDDSPCFHAIKGHGRLHILAHTEFYSIPKCLLQLFVNHFNVWLKPERDEPIEHIFTMFLECLPSINILPFIGVTGQGAITGKNNYI